MFYSPQDAQCLNHMPSFTLSDTAANYLTTWGRSYDIEVSSPDVLQILQLKETTTKRDVPGHDKAEH